MCKTTTAIQLKPGDLFTLPKGRKFKTVSKTIFVTDDQTDCEELKGKILLMYNGCNQLVLSPTDTVLIPNNQI